MQTHLNVLVFSIQLKTESIYRSMIFATSNNIDVTLHPKLVVKLNFCNLDSSAKKKTLQGPIYKGDDLNTIKALNNDKRLSFSVKNLIRQLRILL